MSSPTLDAPRRRRSRPALAAAPDAPTAPVAVDDAARYVMGHPDVRRRPVLYLDVDGVVLRLNDWLPFCTPLAARAFLLWALDQFEVRWLTYWATTGVMCAESVDRLARAWRLPRATVAGLRGLPWYEGDKDEGIAWVEHLALGRPFLWVEDGILEREKAVLASVGALDAFVNIDVSPDPHHLYRVWEAMRDGRVRPVVPTGVPQPYTPAPPPFGPPLR